MDTAKQLTLSFILGLLNLPDLFLLTSLNLFLYPFLTSKLEVTSKSLVRFVANIFGAVPQSLQSVQYLSQHIMYGLMAFSQRDVRW